MNYRIDLKPMEKFDYKLAQSQAGNHPQPLRDCYDRWAVRYYAETKRNFQRNSRGGGQWKPLASSTLKQKKKKTSILIRTGTLLGALGVKAPGSSQQYIEGGIRLGFDGKRRHSRQSSATIQDIANYHQKGGGNLPQRMILNLPSKNTVEGMRRDYAEALRDLMK